MKRKDTKTKNVVKTALIAIIIAVLSNCKEQDYQTVVTENHATDIPYKAPFQKIDYKELLNDPEFSGTQQLLEKHTYQPKLSKKSGENKNTSDKKLKLSIVKNKVIKIERNNTITWTFELEKRLFKKTNFENFIVKKNNNKYTYFLVAYFDMNETDKKAKGTSYSFEIPKEVLEAKNLPVFARGTAFDWADEDQEGGGGTIDTSDPCEGIWIEEYKPCNKGGRADGHAPTLQYDGVTYCNGSDFIGYIIDFSHCGTGSGTYDPPSGPSNGSTDPGDPTPTPGGGGGSISDGSGSSGSDSDSTEDLVSSPIPPDENNECPEGYVKNPTTGECESICKGGKIYNTTTKLCECPEGMIENTAGKCIPDPCKTLSLQLSNPNYKAKIEELKTKVGEKKESGYKQNKDGVYAPLAQTAHGHSAVFNIDADTRGYIHTHLNDFQSGVDSKTGYPIITKPIKIFSPTDVIKFLTLLKRTTHNGIPIHLVYGAVVTGDRSYVLTFTGDVNFPTDHIKGASFYKKTYKQMVQKKTKSSLEKAFLLFLRDHIKVDGVNLYRFKDDGTIQKKSLNKAGDLVTDEC